MIARRLKYTFTVMHEISEQSMENCIFVVNDEPYCLWEENLTAKTREFLAGLDPGYFDYCLSVHSASEDVKRASLALRQSLQHALETLFSLLGAFVQAPTCPYAWLAKCSNKELRVFVQRVSDEDSSLLRSKVLIPKVSWEAIGEIICANFTNNPATPSDTGAQFGKLWSHLAHEFVQDDVVEEYNAIKHGLRVTNGGFGLAIGRQAQQGERAPAHAMKTIASSQFGTSFLRIEAIGKDRKNRSLRSKRISKNWSPDQVSLLLNLTYMSIQNVVSGLKGLNGVPSDECQYLRPTDVSEYHLPWKQASGATLTVVDFVVDETNSSPCTKEELLDVLRAADK